MGTKGIQLVFDEHGEPQVAKPEEKTEECLAGVQCRYAEKEEDEKTIKLSCLESGEPHSPFSYLQCPRGRWGPIEGLGSNNQIPRIYQHHEDLCYSCMTATMWRIKPKKGETDDHWICFNCHPPAPGIPKKKIQKRKRSQIEELK